MNMTALMDLVINALAIAVCAWVLVEMIKQNKRSK